LADHSDEMVVVLCNDAEIEVPDGEICQICGCELEEFDEVTGTGIHGYYHWICVTMWMREMRVCRNMGDAELTNLHNR